MLGAIVGDIVGSRFEFDNIRTKEFELFTDACAFTDDTVHTLAVCQALLDCQFSLEGLSDRARDRIIEFTEQHPRLSYGTRFNQWRLNEGKLPYNSCGNGSAMRVSGCGLVARTLEEALALSDAVTGITHNHPDGMLGARAVTAAIFLTQAGWEKKKIEELINNDYYPMNFTLEEIRPNYSRGRFLNTCSVSVPQALKCYFESDSFEDAVRNAVSIGGDSDTLAAIAGSVAAVAYGIPQDIAQEAEARLDDQLKGVLHTFEAALASR